jgi:predicted O-methyltransferase YrrM
VAQKRLSKFSNYTFIIKPSLEAFDDFDDESLDFVYIDANHDFPNFINDLHEWLKKVKTGGIMSGHDYANFSYRKFNHVKRALDAYARCYHMISLFIVGSEEKAEGVKRDRFRSWFWIKQ